MIKRLAGASPLFSMVKFSAIQKENEKIATVHAGNLYDLNGILVGHLQGTHVIGRDATMPVSFKKLLGGE